MKNKWILPIATLCLLGNAPAVFATDAAKAEKTEKTQNSANQLQNIAQLKNTYVGVRHGQSVPSSEERVCATMESGVDPKNALTEKGRQEVKDSTVAWSQANKDMVAKALKDKKLVIVASPFSRTKESAEILADTLQDQFKKDLSKEDQKEGSLRKLIVVENDMREREFGEFEGKLNSKEIYEKVWAEDKKNADQKKWGVESTNSVQKRASAVIAKLDGQGEGKIYLLVAHGDTLKILQTAFQKQSAGEHATVESVKPIKTAEFRPFTLAGAAAAPQAAK